MEAALTPACALELIHTYSLIHDDLPCMDDDDFRRGKPTVHKQFDEGTAVLVGDFLLTYAFKVLSHAPLLTDSQRIQLIQTLSDKAGGSGMIGGQILDIEATNAPTTIELISHMHSKKTGQLISAALEFGAIICNAESIELQRLTIFGQKIGLAFQIMDDVIDVESSLKKHGKTLSSDQFRNKSTYVSHLGLQGAKDAAENELQNALKLISNLTKSAPLADMAQAFINREI